MAVTSGYGKGLCIERDGSGDHTALVVGILHFRDKEHTVHRLEGDAIVLGIVCMSFIYSFVLYTSIHSLF